MLLVWKRVNDLSSFICSLIHWFIHSFPHRTDIVEDLQCVRYYASQWELQVRKTQFLLLGDVQRPLYRNSVHPDDWNNTIKSQNRDLNGTLEGIFR